jgi:MoxR-like ATPase
MTKINHILNQIVENVEKVIVGKKRQIELVLISLMCNGHMLIEDVPGVGKTSLVSAFAKSLNASFKRIQFTPDITPSDITGFNIFNQKNSEFEYRQGLVMCNILLADEINRTSPKTQSSLLEAMQEGNVTVDGITYALPKPFMVLATENPVEYLGTHPLPEAQLDRFFMKISIGYPSFNDEISILEKFKESNPLENCKPIINTKTIEQLQHYVKKVHIDKALYGYIVGISNEIRNSKEVLLGTSPRASLALYRASQAFALYNCRSYVTPEDIKFMAPYVLSHRITLNQEAITRKITAEDIVNNIINIIKVPI